MVQSNYIQSIEDITSFLDTIKEIGGERNRACNPSVMKKLGWDEAKYWGISGYAMDHGLIEKGDGPGGSVILDEDACDNWKNGNNHAFRI